MKSHDLERAFQVSVFFLNAKRASVFKPRMKSVISSTPAHASFCHCAYGLIANWKIVTGSVAIGWRRSALKKWLDNTVNNSGAVSPEMRATDSKHPVTMPLAAALSAIAPIIFHFGAPSANAASRNASGTSLSIFSVVRTIIGICRIASAIAPAQPLKWRNKERVHKQTDHNRRRAEQNIVDKAHAFRQPAAAPIFSQINARQNTQRRADRCCQSGEHQTSGDGIDQSAPVCIWRRRACGQQ